jgi:hypothetical protein
MKEPALPSKVEMVAIEVTLAVVVDSTAVFPVLVMAVVAVGFSSELIGHQVVYSVATPFLVSVITVTPVVTGTSEHLFSSQEVMVITVVD